MKIRIDTFHAKGPTGAKIHHVAIRPPDNRYTLLCSSLDELGSLTGVSNWEPTRKPVTCKHCLKAIRRHHHGI